MMGILNVLVMLSTASALDTDMEASLYVGTAWQTARFRYNIHPRVSLDTELQVASFLRWQPSIGVTAVWLDGGYQLRGTLLGGWLYEDSASPWNGPSAEARVVLSRMKGLVRPWLQLGSKHSIGYLRSNIETAEKTLVEDTLQTEWTLTGVMGLSVNISNGVEAGLGIDFPWVRYPEISIPGFHIFAVYRAERK